MALPAVSLQSCTQRHDPITCSAPDPDRDARERVAPRAVKGRSVADHRSPSGHHARPAATRGGVAHRAPSTGRFRTGVVAAAAAVGAVASGAVTTLLPGGPPEAAADTVATAVASVDPVLAASAGVLRERSARPLKTANTLLPVAYTCEAAALSDRMIMGPSRSFSHPWSGRSRTLGRLR